MSASKKIEKQTEINQNVSQIKQTWTALLPAVARWENTFLHNDSVGDLVGLNKNLKLESTGFKIKGSTISEGTSSVVIYNGVDIGLAERCVKNSPGGYLVTSRTINNALKSMEKIDIREDLNWNKLTIKANDHGFDIRFSELCSRYRIKGGNI